MAGPRFLAAGGVVNPYEGLQSAVAQVGQIYQNYEENARRQAEFKAQEDERNRVKSMREFAANYDARVGDDYRGIDAGMRPLVEQAETQARKRWQAANPNAAAEQTAAFDNELRSARRSLATAEDVASTVTNDYIRAGFSPAEAEAFGRQAAAGFGSRGAALAQAQAEAEARNAAADKMSQRLLELYKVQSASDNASIRALGASNGGRGVNNGTSKTSGSLVDPKKSMALQEFFSETIGSSDARDAMANFEQGMALYNENARRNGGTPVNFDQAQAAAVSNLSRGGIATDNKALYRDPAEFAAILTEQYGPADASNTRNNVGGVDRQTLISGMRTGISNAERMAILNPSRTVVNPEQVVRAQVASAYSRLFPESARENPELVSRASRTDTTPARRAAPAATSTGSQRYRPSAPAPLEAGATRGTGFTELPRPTTSSTSQESPADVPSSPERQGLSQPIPQSRQIALAVNAAAQSDSPQSQDARRLLQKLEIDNPELLDEVRDEMRGLRRKQTYLNYANTQIRDLTDRISAEERRLKELDPATLSTVQRRASWLGDRTSDYQEYLRDTQKLEQTRETLKKFQQRQATLRDELGTGTEPDFTVLRSLLK